MGEGQGSGGNNDCLVAGGVCAACTIGCFIFLGLPMLIAGVVLVQLNISDEFELEDNTLQIVGIVLIVLASVFLVVGIAISIVMCTRKRNNNAANTTGTVIQYPGQVQYVNQPGYGQPPQYYAQPGYQPQQPGYQPQQPGYQPQQQAYQPPPQEHPQQTNDLPPKY